jgi:hypothetical protein
MKFDEYNEQKSLMTWCKLAAKTISDLKSFQYTTIDKTGFEETNIGYTLYSNGNSIKLTALQAMRNKQVGLGAGVPDLFLAKARQGYHGLYIEMKCLSRKPKKSTSKGGLSDVQIARIKQLREDGYRVEICYGWIEARDVILNYLNIEE